MPEYLAPGVYVEELSFRSKSIEGVSTSTRDFQRINYSKKNKKCVFSRMIIILRGRKGVAEGNPFSPPHLCMKNLYTCRLL